MLRKNLRLEEISQQDKCETLKNWVKKVPLNAEIIVGGWVLKMLITQRKVLLFDTETTFYWHSEDNFL